MTETLFLVKYGEIALKKRNRPTFLKRLKESIKAKLPSLPSRLSKILRRSLWISLMDGQKRRRWDYIRLGF